MNMLHLVMTDKCKILSTVNYNDRLTSTDTIVSNELIILWSVEIKRMKQIKYINEDAMRFTKRFNSELSI